MTFQERNAEGPPVGEPLSHCYDSTQLNDFRRCPAFFQHRHVKGLVLDGGSKHSDPLAAGSALHSGVEAWFGRDCPSCHEHCISAVKASWGTDDLFLPEKAKYTQGFLAAVMAGYADAWPRENDSFKVLANEQWLQSGNYGGIVDRLVEFEDGVYVMDTKTTSGWVNERYIESFQLSSQFRGYVSLAERGCTGAYLDAIHLDTRYHKVKPSDFVREKILFSEEQIAAWQRDKIRTIATIEDYRKHYGDSQWPQNDQRCFDWNRPCPYWRLCTAVIPENELDFYKEKRWEPWK